MTEQDTPNMTHDEMIDVLKGLVFGTFDRTTAKEREALDMAISALSETEIKGEWILVVDSYYEDGTIKENHWECSKCGSGKSGWGEYKFCPDCGADMRGD